MYGGDILSQGLGKERIEGNPSKKHILRSFMDGGSFARFGTNIEIPLFITCINKAVEAVWLLHFVQVPAP
jgi:hypothetical protein